MDIYIQVICAEITEWLNASPRSLQGVCFSGSAGECSVEHFKHLILHYKRTYLHDVCLLQEAYRAFHTNFSRVHKYMATIRIGRLEASDITSADDEVKKDFEELREKAKQLVSRGCHHKTVKHFQMSNDAIVAVLMSKVHC